ncbi:MAG: hypothetical protein U0903_17550 [Planctomycetales bacterium]
MLMVLLLVLMTTWAQGDEATSEVEFQAASRCEAIIQRRGEDLNLSDDQKEKIQKILIEMNAPVGDPTKIPEGDEARKLEAEMRQKTIDGEKKIREVLTPEQLVIYRRLFISMVGVIVFDHPELVKELEITSKQREQIKRLIKDYDADMRSALDKKSESALSTVESATKFLKLKEELTTKYRGKILGVLTAEQKEKFEKIAGTTDK